MMQTEGQQEENVAEQVDPVAHPLGEVRGDDVDADMLVALQSIGGGEHEDGAVQIPLQFEPGVRRGVEHLADRRVAGADQHGDQGSAMTPTGR
jgi:hypothetical protein